MNQTMTPATGRLFYKCCPCCGSDAISELFEVEDYLVSSEYFGIWSCAHCNFAFTQGQPDARHVAAYYKSENYLSHSDAKKGWFAQLYHRARRLMLHHKARVISRYTDGRRLLDIGSGTAYFVHFMQGQGYEVTGIEIDKDARAYGEKKFGVATHAPDDWLNGKQHGPYDIITLWHVLEHLHDLKSYIRMMHRVLAPGGILVAAVPNRTSTDGVFYGAEWEGYDVPRHLWHFSPKSMQRLMEEHGFELERIHLMPFDPIYNAILSERNRGNSLGLLRAPFVGLWALVNALQDRERSSSPMFIFRKKDA